MSDIIEHRCIKCGKRYYHHTKFSCPRAYVEDCPPCRGLTPGGHLVFEDDFTAEVRKIREEHGII